MRMNPRGEVVRMRWRTHCEEAPLKIGRLAPLGSRDGETEEAGRLQYPEGQRWRTPRQEATEQGPPSGQAQQRLSKAGCEAESRGRNDAAAEAG